MENKDLGKFSIFFLIIGCAILLTLYMGLGLTKITEESITITSPVSLNLDPIHPAEKEDKWVTYTKNSPSVCLPDYPTMCLSSALQKITCQELRVGDTPYRNFEVLMPDSLGFDPDGNGVGCEEE